jgi:hypothetical protein
MKTVQANMAKRTADDKHLSGKQMSRLLKKSLTEKQS